MGLAEDEGESMTDLEINKLIHEKELAKEIEVAWEQFPSEYSAEVFTTWAAEHLLKTFRVERR